MIFDALRQIIVVKGLEVQFRACHWICSRLMAQSTLLPIDQLFSRPDCGTVATGLWRICDMFVICLWRRNSLAVCSAACHCALPLCSPLRAAHGSHAILPLAPPPPPKSAPTRAAIPPRKFCVGPSQPYLKHAYSALGEGFFA